MKTNNDITIEKIPFSGVIHVFDMTTNKTIFTGTEDTIPKDIMLQIPKKVYCANDIMYIDIHYQNIYFDTEAKWYYYESFFRSQFEEYTEQDKTELFNNSFDEFMRDTLKHEPIEKV